MSYVDELKRILDNEPKPDCASLTPFFLLDADQTTGQVSLRLEPHSAFNNHLGNVPLGFAVSMVDVLLSVATFAKTNAWLPIVDVKCCLMAPLRFGECKGTAAVIRASESLVFLEARLWGADLRLAVHATAIATMPTE